MKEVDRKNVVVIATLDTKGEEAGYLKRVFSGRGCGVIVVDIGILGNPLLEAEVSREEVAERGGVRLERLVKDAETGADRSRAIAVMGEGCRRVLNELYSSRRVDGVVSLGGSTGTSIAVEAMRDLPVGLPKLAVTTDLDRVDVGGRDIVLFQSPADILGLNAVMRKAFLNASAALLGMMGVGKEKGKGGRIAVIGCLEADGKEMEYVKEVVEREGSSVTVFDVSGGVGEAMDSVGRLASLGMLDGVISVGGPGSSTAGIAVMKALPVCFPKVVATTARSVCFVGTNDVMLLPIPESVRGDEECLRRLLDNAAGAITGMMDVKDVEVKSDKPLIGVTALGVTTPAVKKVISLMREKGYDVISFHARTGVLSKLVSEGRVDGVIDLTPTEVVQLFLYPGAEEFLGGKDRLGVAGRKGLPQVISPGGLDMLIFSGSVEQVPEEFRGRPIHVHGPQTVLIRTTREEVEASARKLVERANRAKGPVAIVIPLRGFSAVDREGHRLYDPAADRGFIEAVRESASPKVEVVEVDAHINDELFAVRVVEVFDRLFHYKQGGG
nr:Tm-1-like ATP-binding domain-containing protein [Candidatus Freyrarchaeum guaymaensis]